MTVQPDAHVQHNIPNPQGTIWFGMRCSFTRAALDGALATGDTTRPVAIVLPGAPRPRTTGWPEPPFDRWLHTRNIAVIDLAANPQPDWEMVTATIDAARPVVGVMACFPYRVPREVYTAFPHGILNIHPSLLPRLRGPEPVFHAYRLGLDTTGVSIHLIDDGWDTGPVAHQVEVPIPEDNGARVFEAALARIGGEMIPETIRQLVSGSVRTEPQDASQASWAPVPTEEDHIIPGFLTVQRAIRMAVAVGDAFGPLAVRDRFTGDVTPIAGVARDLQDHSAHASAPHGIVEAGFADGIARFQRATGDDGSRPRY